jgi:hypothetical protein
VTGTLYVLNRDRKASVAVHVDIVKNDWLAGVQQLLARVYVVDGRPVVDNLSGLSARFVDGMLLSAGDGPDPSKDPRGFLGAIQHRIAGTYVFATAPHDDDADCGFHGGAVPHLEPVNVEQAKLAEA